MGFMTGNRAYALATQYINKIGKEIEKDAFKVQVEEYRSILETTGQEKVFYFLPKDVAKPQDGYDEFIYTNNAWEQVGVTDVDLSGVETEENLVTSLSAESTDTEFPSAKCVYDIFGDIAPVDSSAEEEPEKEVTE